MLKKRAAAHVVIFSAVQHFPAACEADRLAAFRRIGECIWRPQRSGRQWLHCRSDAEVQPYDKGKSACFRLSSGVPRSTRTLGAARRRDPTELPSDLRCRAFRRASNAV